MIKVFRSLRAFFAFLLSVVVPLAVLFVLMSLLCCVPAMACPRIVEIFPDPVDVGDQEGEFAEIRLDPVDEGGFDSLIVQFEEKAAIRMPYPSGATRVVLVHDSASCPKNAMVKCGLLGNINLPNSRESFWRSWGVVKDGAMSCLDSVNLPAPKAGKSLQRVKDTDLWEIAAPTMGGANSDYEIGIKDCGLNPLRSLSFANADDLKWKIQFSLGGCDSSWISYGVLDLYGGNRFSGQSTILDTFSVDGVSGGAIHVVAALPSDEVVGNDLLDTILVAPGKSPLVISEVHHCPQEPEPEWVEVYNRTAEALPLQKFRFCGRGNVWGRNESDSISPFQSVIFTKDSAGLLETLGYKDARIIQISLGYLNNTSGSVSICYGDVLLDSVGWDKSTVSCPLGFNPLTGKAEYTPGFQGVTTKNTSPFTYKVSSRVVRRGGMPLRVLVESDFPVSMKLLDSTGRVLWRVGVPAGSSTWWTIPLDGLPRTGIAYVSLSSGMFEKRIGFVLRP